MVRVCSTTLKSIRGIRGISYPFVITVVALLPLGESRVAEDATGVKHWSLNRQPWIDERRRLRSVVDKEWLIKRQTSSIS